jgi:cytochrome c oxidase subunit IV
MSGFSNYEGDQSALYSGGHHQDRNSPESKALVKKIWKVTAILSLVTIVEVALGLWCYKSTTFPKGWANIFFVILTIFKAGYIVKVFMHLGDELKNMILTILIPLTLFIWFIIAFLYEGGFWLHMNQAVDKF